MSVYVIAEIGSNHNGSITEAIRLFVDAKEAGADCVKVQHIPDETYGPHPLTFKRLRELGDIATALGIDYLASVFDQGTLDEWLRLERCAVKIASPELTRTDLLEAIPGFVHTYLSCGMSTLEQIDQAIATIQGDVTLLQCVSAYPAPPGDMNLETIPRLIADYGLPVGLSDHTLHPTAAPVAAVALGATVIEKHLTLDRTADGPDHAYALEPAQFAQMVEAIRLTELMLGDGHKRVMPSEDSVDRRALWA